MARGASAAQGSSEDIGPGCRALPSIGGPVWTAVEGDSDRSPRLGHASFGLTTALFDLGSLPSPAGASAKALPTRRIDTPTRAVSP